MKAIKGPDSTVSWGAIPDDPLHARRLESIGAQATGIAHDLNNILSAVLLSTRMLRDRLCRAEDLALLEVAESGSHRAAELARQILTFALGTDRPSTGISPHAVIEEIAKMIRATFPPSINVQIEVTDSLWSIPGDATHLHRVLLNLSVNARDAMPHGGTLTLRASNLEAGMEHGTTTGQLGAGRSVLLEVSDTGAGIAPEIRERIFEPFFTTKEPGKGTGLGLAAVKSIVESHGGRLECESAFGRGTTFRILLPAGPAGTTPSKAIRPCHGQGELILVVDDEEPLRDLIRATLEHSGYRVITAADGAAGLALFADHRNEIAVVISDHHMPVMDGSAMLRAIHHIAPEMRTVTASGQQPATADSQAEGGSACMTIAKPWTAESLLGAVSTLLNAGDVSRRTSR